MCTLIDNSHVHYSLIYELIQNITIHYPANITEQGNLF